MLLKAASNTPRKGLEELGLVLGSTVMAEIQKLGLKLSRQVDTESQSCELSQCGQDLEWYDLGGSHCGQESITSFPLFLLPSSFPSFPSLSLPLVLSLIRLHSVSSHFLGDEYTTMNTIPTLLPSWSLCVCVGGAGR